MIQPKHKRKYVCTLYRMSFFPCYLLFNEHEFGSKSSCVNDDACFPCNISGVWAPMMSQQSHLFKGDAPVDVKCSDAPISDSCPCSVPCCTSSLESTALVKE